MILGFTGTRRGLKAVQAVALVRVFQHLRPTVLIHGGAVGADGEAHDLAHECYDVPVPHFEVYPADEASAERWRRILTHTDGRLAGTVHPAMPPLVRDRIIAARCDRLVACPAEPDERARGGTWSTVRYARAARKPVTLVLPDGTVREEEIK